MVTCSSLFVGLPISFPLNQAVHLVSEHGIHQQKIQKYELKATLTFIDTAAVTIEKMNMFSNLNVGNWSKDFGQNNVNEAKLVRS